MTVCGKRLGRIWAQRRLYTAASCKYLFGACIINKECYPTQRLRSSLETTYDTIQSSFSQLLGAENYAEFADTNQFSKGNACEYLHSSIIQPAKTPKLWGGRSGLTIKSICILIGVDTTAISQEFARNHSARCWHYKCGFLTGHSWGCSVDKIH